MKKYYMDRKKTFLYPMREDGYQPDYHVGAVETSQISTFSRKRFGMILR